MHGMKSAAVLLLLSLMTPPLRAQGIRVGLRPVAVIPLHRSAAFAQDSAGTAGWQRGMEIGAGTGAGFFLMVFVMFGAQDRFPAKPFLVTTAMFAVIGGFVGAIASGK